MANLLIALGSSAGIIAVALLGFALYERSVAARTRQRLLAIRPEAASQHAASNVVRARSEFSLAVEAYERAMAASSRVAEPSVIGASGTTLEAPLPPTHIQDLEQQKDRTRTELLDAQRLWESVRPSADVDASVSLWSGFGVLRGWQFGPVGFERAFVRTEHIIDPSCWAVWEVKRMRFGLALGAETQRLALFGAAVPTDRVGEILGQGMGGGEVAFRPGFSPQRWWRRSRRLPEAQLATDKLLALRSVDAEIDRGSRKAVDSALEDEMGQPVDTVASLGDMDGLLSVLAGGPSLLVGAWWGTEPTAELLAGSAHTAWRHVED